MDPISPIKIGKAAEAPTTGGKSVEDLIADVKSRLDQIRQLEQEQSAYLSSDDQAQLKKMEGLLKGSEAVLEQYLKTGGALPGSGTEINNVNMTSSANLPVGWSGPADYAKDPSGTYDQIITPYNKGNGPANGLVFKMDDTMESVKQRNVKDGIEHIVVYRDGSQKSTLIKGAVTSPTPIAIMADQTTKGVVIDCSQVKRVGNLKSGAPDLFITGGSGDDILIGSQGTDTVSGGLGNDTIYGHGGFDSLDGGMGADTIYGGSGHATIVGGDGADTVHVAKGDKATGEEETVTIATTPLDKKNFSSPDGGWSASVDKKNGELSLTRNASAGNAGTLKLTVPDGAMVYGKEDGKDLVLTYQMVNDDGTMGDTQVVRITGVLDPASRATIQLTSQSQPDHPTIIDLSAVKTQYNQVLLKKGKGDDVIIAPQSALEGMKLKPSDVGTSSLPPKTIETIHKSVEKTDKDGSKTYWANGDNGDSLKDFPGWDKPAKLGGTGVIELYPKDSQEQLDLNTEIKGYDFMGALQQEDKDGKGVTVTLFIQKDGSKTVERLVLHIVKSGGNPKTITMNSGFEIPLAGTAVQFLGNNPTDSGGIFVGNPYGTDSSKAGKNKIIDQ